MIIFCISVTIIGMGIVLVSANLIKEEVQYAKYKKNQRKKVNPKIELYQKLPLIGKQHKSNKLQ